MHKVFLVVAFVVFGVAAGAATYYAADDGTGNASSWATAGTLDTAMNAAGAGDSVWVKEGVYTGDGNAVLELKEGVSVYGGFLGTEGELESADPYSNVTTISGEGVRRCVIAADNAVLDGVNLDNGKAKRGAGIYNNGKSFTFSRSSITSCVALDSGAGIFNDRVSENNTGVILSQCQFAANKADWNGGGIYNYESKVTATNCVFYQNTAQNDGGGMFNYFCAPTLMNCTFTDNTATRGGAIRAVQEGPSADAMVITNSILWGNNSDTEIYLSSSTDPVITYSCIEGGWDGNTGGITTDPVFDDEASFEWMLDSTSPCIDTGTATGAPAVDILGTARPQGAGMDIGAYEYAAP